jgi:hypothetical protein
MPEGFSLLDDELNWPRIGRTLWDIVQVDYGHRTKWELRIELEHDGRLAEAVFDHVVSYRVHDEREIFQYWAALARENAPVGTIYVIQKSDYLNEIKRGSTGLVTKSLRHFLLAGMNICVEVIGSGNPTLSMPAR